MHSQSIPESNDLRTFLRVEKDKKKRRANSSENTLMSTKRESKVHRRGNEGCVPSSGVREWKRLWVRVRMMEGRRERKRRERRVLLSLAEGDRRGYVNGAAGEGAEGIGACLCAEWLRPCEPASLPLLRSLHFPKASQKKLKKKLKTKK